MFSQNETVGVLTINKWCLSKVIQLIIFTVQFPFLLSVFVLSLALYKYQHCIINVLLKQNSTKPACMKIVVKY